MAQTKKSNSSTKRKTSNSSRSNSSRSRNTANSRSKQVQDDFNEELTNEIVMILVLAVLLLLFLCNFRILGVVGNAVSDVMFGLFGLVAYVAPILIGYIAFINIVNQRSSKALRRSWSLVGLTISLSMAFELMQHGVDNGLGFGEAVKDIFMFAYDNRKAGGVVGGILAHLCVNWMGNVGTVLLLIILIIVFLVLLTEKSFVKGIKDASSVSKRAIERSAQGAEERAQRRQELSLQRKEEARRIRAEREEALRKAREEEALRAEVIETEKFLKNPEKAAPGDIVTIADNSEEYKERDDIHEINLKEFDDEPLAKVNSETRVTPKNIFEDSSDAFHEIKLNFENDYPIVNNVDEPYYDEEPIDYREDIAPVSSPVEEQIEATPYDDSGIVFHHELKEDTDAPKPISTGSIFRDGHDNPTNGGRTFGTQSGTAKDIEAAPVKKVPNKPYKKPPIDLLKKGEGSKNGDRNELMNTARKLEQVLESFNVKAKVTDVSQGPAVTRYEMIPETGVKVSKILGLQDDLKLNLAAADIRIEAPIPGKAAIGIEVPNKEASAVALRDLIDSKEFKASESKLSFAVGKDLAGKVVVTDIAKMPHMLIAGATGSGKSVCINTLIMSILYKADPREVKLIMIDPKVVELSVYNGIPHLLIPVVTDPRKANASLAWAVREMDNRYQKFAEYGVRDLKGYNAKIETEKDVNGDPVPKMYQLVVIVDELADLMMVAGKEVEESICRLAQLARAAGIHLIIATQRPSVDVITGLIKANMPSRVSFAVSSGTDSRTILDMVGAEKLLGKGDMLFYPQGYTKPARVQGAFVSDKEVSDVVDFLKQNGAGYDESDSTKSIQDSISAAASGNSSNNMSAGAGGMDSDEDEFFYEAGKLICETGKCSIGMLQRKFKIGFNRAARIMDSLSDAGVVGPEEGTKARSILMSPEQFDNFIESR